MERPPLACPWLPDLAAGYLRQYERIHRQQKGGLWGYDLVRKRGRPQVGFFVGFLIERSPKRGKTSSLIVHPPECAVMAFVRPTRLPLHRRLVREPANPFRRAFELLTKYTLRRPRFEFHEREAGALIRHVPLAAFPPGEEEKYARNFFMETLALVVRSGLPEKLVGATRFPVTKPKKQTPRLRSG